MPGSIKSRSSAGSHKGEAQRQLLEAQANLAKLQLQKRLEAEERAALRDAQERSLAGKAEADLLDAQFEVQRKQLEADLAEDAEGSLAASETSSRAGSKADDFVTAINPDQKSKIDQWRRDVNQQSANDDTVLRNTHPDWPFGSPVCFSTPFTPTRPLDPSTNPFVPRPSTHEHTTGDPMAHGSYVLKAHETNPFVPRPSTHEYTTGDPMAHGSYVLKALESTLASSNELARTSLLPPTKLERFGGDFTKYAWFKKSFRCGPMSSYYKTWLSCWGFCLWVDNTTSVLALNPKVF